MYHDPPGRLLPSRHRGRASPLGEMMLRCLVAAIGAALWNEAGDAILSFFSHGDSTLHFALLSAATFLANTCSSLTGTKL